MKLIALSIEGFRGIKRASIKLGNHTVIVGPNGSGKSTIIDAMSLVLGRTRLVRSLTEHDFYGSCPSRTSRIRIIATLGGFSSNDPDRHDAWFRVGRAVPKWWNRETGRISPEPKEDPHELCAQIAFSARFDCEELSVEQIRYFHDDDAITDVFQEDVVQQVPYRLLDDVGYYVLPARRTWEASLSFASELFRKAVATVGGVPAQAILEERDRLRQPQSPLEYDIGLSPLIERINKQLSQLLPESPQFCLRLTSTDSDSLLQALVPHYQTEDDIPLPIVRHGTGLLSLQTFILLLELGRERKRQGKSFMLAMEEPELHVPPGLQRRLVSQTVSIADQTVCTSHSPRVAAFYPATSVQLLEKRGTQLAATPLLAQPLDAEASNAIRKLFHEERARVVEALMYYYVVIPEGRSEHEWFRLLADVIETGERALKLTPSAAPPFGAVVGVVPTHDSAVIETFGVLRRTRSGLVPLVDGDKEGDKKIKQLCDENPAPEVILQWPENWTMEDAIGWILRADEKAVLGEINRRVDRGFGDIDELIAGFKIRKGPGRLKTDYLAYQEVGQVIGSYDGCLERAEQLLEAITLACISPHSEYRLIRRDSTKSSPSCLVLRFSP
ncbi:MAG: AAA family ATPase [Firmicutes bacterium]|nr:AAA family ATPase [Bacillota bacterium]